GEPLARVPIAVLSIDDAEFLDSADAVRSFMPPGMPKLSKKVVSALRDDITAGTSIVAWAINANGMAIDIYRQPEENTAGYILVVPGSRHFTEDFFRVLSGLNLPVQKISPQLWHKIALWAAVHEATHAGLNAAGLPSSEYSADTGSLLLSRNPAFFGEPGLE